MLHKAAISTKSKSLHKLHVMSTFFALAAVQALLFAFCKGADTGNTFSKPVLGYNTYNAVACSPTQQFVETQIDALSANGYLKLGYNTFGIDCGWQSRSNERDPTTGAIAINADAFPQGIAPLSQRATNAGMRWAMYSDAGYRACDLTVPSPVTGSLGHEQADAEQFARWNTSYVKYDNCYADGPNADQNAPKDPRTDFVTRFSTMTSALRDVGIQGQLTCQWGVPFVENGRTYGPADWTRNISTSFRLSDDISDSWDSVVRIINQAIHISASDKTGPGFHQDGDLLEVGNQNLNFAQQQTHFAYWAMIKSALLISTDVTKLSDQEKGLLQNKALIDVNQDDLGKPIQLVQRWTDDHDLYAGPLANGDLAVLAINWQTSARSLGIDFGALSIASADVEDLFTGAKQSGVSSYSANVDGYAPIALRLSNVNKVTTSPASLTYIEAEAASVSGAASVQDCSGCSGGKKVGSIGGTGNTLTFTNVAAKSADMVVEFDYVNAEIGYLNQKNNERRATVTVNNNAPVTVSFPLTGYDWTHDVAKAYRVALSGFNTQGTNTITVSAPNGQYAPDVDRIGF